MGWNSYQLKPFPRDFQKCKKFHCGPTQWKIMKVQSLAFLGLYCWAPNWVSCCFSAVCWATKNYDLPKDFSSQATKIHAKKSFKLRPDLAVLTVLGHFLPIFQAFFSACLDKPIQTFLLWWGSARYEVCTEISLVRQSLILTQQW